MQTLPLTPSNPMFNNFMQVMEPTILRYTKNGRWFELHLTNQMRSMFGLDRDATFEEIPRSIQSSIVYNFHEKEGFDVTQEVAEEVENVGYAFHLIIA